MSFNKHKQKFFRLLRESVMMIVGAILIWRGVWVLLDRFDIYFFEGKHILSSVIGVVIGIALIYWADRGLEDIV